MELTLEFITTELDGFYPNSTKLTPKILGEMYGMLKRLGWTENDFSHALSLYRNDPLRLETRTLGIPPDVRQLIQLLAKEKQPTYSPVYINVVPPPEWTKGAMAALKNDGRLGLAIYMLKMCDSYPSLHREWWENEMEYLQTRDTPQTVGNLNFAGVLA